MTRTKQAARRHNGGRKAARAWQPEEDEDDSAGPSTSYQPRSPLLEPLDEDMYEDVPLDEFLASSSSRAPPLATSMMDVDDEDTSPLPQTAPGSVREMAEALGLNTPRDATSDLARLLTKSGKGLTDPVKTVEVSACSPRAVERACWARSMCCARVSLSCGVAVPVC